MSPVCLGYRAFRDSENSSWDLNSSFRKHSLKEAICDKSCQSNLFALMLKIFLLALVKVFSEVLGFLCSLSVRVQISKMLTYKAEQILCSVFTVKKFHTDNCKKCTWKTRLSSCSVCRYWFVIMFVNVWSVIMFVNVLVFLKVIYFLWQH